MKNNQPWARLSCVTVRIFTVSLMVRIYMLRVNKSHLKLQLMQNNWCCRAIKPIFLQRSGQMCWRFIDINMWCYTYISSNRYDCVSGTISPQSQPFSRHSCWLPFWGTADICLLSPSDTLLGMGLWHFWLCVCVYVCVWWVILGHAPLTFYWMVMVFIAMAAGEEAGIAVHV